MTRTVRIGCERLRSTLMNLEEIGSYDDEATGLRGNGTDVLGNAVLGLANQA
jgi:hypothetical protein